MRYLLATLLLYGETFQLRDSQGYCTDSECISDAPGPQGAGILAGGNNLMMIAVLWGIIALLMYFMRPNSMRSRPAEPPNKPGPSNGPVSFMFFSFSL